MLLNSLPSLKNLLLNLVVWLLNQLNKQSWKKCVVKFVK